MSIRNELWSVAQDLNLIYCVHKDANFSWKSIHYIRDFSFRSEQTCKDRYKTIIKSAEYMHKLLTESDWKPSDDVKLEKAVEEKKKDWGVISTDLGREGQICEHRFCLLQAVRVHHAALLLSVKEGNYTAPTEAPPPEKPPLKRSPRVTDAPPPEKPPLKRSPKVTEEQPPQKKHEFDVFEPFS